MRLWKTQDVFLKWIGDIGGREVVGWLHMRNPLNDRGESSTVLARKDSWRQREFIEIQGLARGVAQTSTMTVSLCTKMWFMHLASLVEGANLASGSREQGELLRVEWCRQEACRGATWIDMTPPTLSRPISSALAMTPTQALPRRTIFKRAELQRLTKALGIARRGREAGRSKVLATEHVRTSRS